jgi:hypothetical protein
VKIVRSDRTHDTPSASPALPEAVGVREPAAERLPVGAPLGVALCRALSVAVGVGGFAACEPDAEPDAVPASLGAGVSLPVADADGEAEPGALREPEPEALGASTVALPSADAVADVLPAAVADTSGDGVLEPEAGRGDALPAGALAVAPARDGDAEPLALAEGVVVREPGGERVKDTLSEPAVDADGHGDVVTLVRGVCVTDAQADVDREPAGDSDEEPLLVVVEVEPVEGRGVVGRDERLTIVRRGDATKPAKRHERLGAGVERLLATPGLLASELGAHRHDVTSPRPRRPTICVAAI